MYILIKETIANWTYEYEKVLDFLRLNPTNATVIDTDRPIRYASGIADSGEPAWQNMREKIYEWERA